MKKEQICIGNRLSFKAFFLICKMKLMDKFKELSPTAQGMIIIGILLIIGIILRWDEVSQGIISGFKRYSGN